MLNADNIREVAYRADYNTTKNMIESYPELNNDDFWKSKCLILFPKESYLDFYTGEENYLIRERGEFALAVDFSSEAECQNVLFEYFDMLNEVLNLSEEKIHHGMGYNMHYLVKIIVQKRFIIIKNDGGYLIGQCDSESKALQIIKDDAIIHKDDEYGEYIKYIIVDIESITPYFWKLGSISKRRTSKFKIYEIEDVLNL